MLKDLVEIACDIVYPKRCPICENIITLREKKACPSCVESLHVIKEPRCKKCSKPIEQFEQEYCYDCSSKKFHYKKGYALWEYDDQMRKSIAAFKYNNKREYSMFYVEEFLTHYGDILKEISPQGLIPVPLHSSKQKLRGYNQAELIAKGIGASLNVPVMNSVLKRTKKTMPQKQLNDKERLSNLSNAFEVCREYQNNEVKLERAVLVDDIYTTGSTIESCSKVLYEAGVKEVYFITLCIGKGY